MIDRDDTEHVCALRYEVHLLDQRSGRQLCCEGDNRAAAHAGCRAGCRVDCCRERLVEDVGLLLQNEAVSSLWRFRIEPELEKVGGVEADLLGRDEDAARRLLAHRMAPVQHAIDGGNRDAGCVRHVRNRGSAGDAESLRESRPSYRERAR